MEINHRRKTINKTAHYYTLGKLSSKTKYFWMVFHGYAQLAKSLLESFDQLNQDEHFVVAPEGFSRFYRKGFEGDVVASWMTKEDRLDEIADYSKFIHSVYQDYTAQLPDQAKIIVFGYSQGGSTLYRWITSRYPYYDVLVNWAGWVPEDIDYSNCLDYLNAKKAYYIYGLEDPFLPQDRIRALSNFSKEQQLDITFFNFNGQHVIDKAFLKRFVKKCIAGG